MGQAEEMVVPAHEPVELGGVVEEDGTIVLDVTDIDVLTKRLHYVRKTAGKLKKEDGRLTALIRGHKSAKVGYSNPYVRIEGAEDVNLEDERLIKVLKAEGVYETCLQSIKLAVGKVRDAAALNKKVEQALIRATGKTRRVKMQ